jgi:hypothetical protein
MNRSEIDKLLLDIDNLTEVSHDTESSEFSLASTLRQDVAGCIREVSLGAPVVELVYLTDIDLSNPKRKPISQIKLDVVLEELANREFVGSSLPEPPYSGYEEKDGENFTYLTHFRWLGNAICEHVKMVAMEKNITRHKSKDKQVTLGQEIQVLLFNGQTSEAQLLNLGYRKRTRLKFSEYRNYKTV